MSKFYRNRKGFLASLLEGGGLWVALGATLLTVLSLAVIFSAPAEENVEAAGTPSDSASLSLPFLSDSDGTDFVTDQVSSSDGISDGGTGDGAPVEDVGMILPASGTVGHGFSLTVPVFSATMNDWRVHQGIDILTEGEADVVAAADGTVDQIYTDEMMGKTVEILHADGTVSVYQSLADEICVTMGQQVLQGDRIGKTGISADCESLDGHHLHFALVRSGVYLNPQDRFTP